MMTRISFLLDAVRAFRAAGGGASASGHGPAAGRGDPRMRIVLEAINAWRGARTSGHRSSGTLGFVVDALRALKASRGGLSGSAPSSRINAVLEAVRAYRAARAGRY